MAQRQKICRTKQQTAHEVQDALKISETRYRRLFEAAQDGILILDFTTGTIEDVNPFLIKLLGFSYEEFIGKHLWEIGAIMDEDVSREAFAVLQEKGYIRYDDRPLHTKDGHDIRVEFVSNVYDVGGLPVVQCNICDISQRKGDERKLLEYQRAVTSSMHEVLDTLSVVVEERDPYTAGHQSRVAFLSVAIANELGLPQETIEGLRVSALIHDVGKIAVPAEVLTKPTKLSEFEMAMLRNHVQAGFDMIKHVHFPWPVAEIVLQHHERMNGSGYPRGLAGDKICEEARILAVADTVEAMMGIRPYRAALGLEMALHTIEAGSGILFDSDAVNACLRLFREKGFGFPVLDVHQGVALSARHL